MYRLAAVVFLSLLVWTVFVGSGLRAAETGEENEVRRSWDLQAQQYLGVAVKIKRQTEEVNVHWLFKELNGFIAEKNKGDFPRNLDLAERYAAKAMDLQKESPEKARQYVLVAKAYHRCAEGNKEVWDAYGKGDSEALATALGKITQCERVIQETTGKRPVRDWLTPGELTKYIEMKEARKARNKGN